jgi:hypothetical protein
VLTDFIIDNCTKTN